MVELDHRPTVVKCLGKVAVHTFCILPINHGKRYLWFLYKPGNRVLVDFHTSYGCWWFGTWYYYQEYDHSYSNRSWSLVPIWPWTFVVLLQINRLRQVNEDDHLCHHVYVEDHEDYDLLYHYLPCLYDYGEDHVRWFFGIFFTSKHEVKKYHSETIRRIVEANFIGD